MNHAPSGNTTVHVNEVTGDQAWVSDCRCGDQRRHRHGNARRTSLAIVNHKARFRLGSTMCSSSGRNHLRFPTMWVYNLASNASSGGVQGRRLGNLHRGRLRTDGLESTICISGGRNHRRWPTIWDDNPASNASVSGGGEGVVGAASGGTLACEAAGWGS